MPQQEQLEKKLSAREQREQDIAFSDEDVITRMMKVLEYRWYVDTDWRSEETFEEDVRPLFKKMLQQPQEEKVVEIKVSDWFKDERCCKWCTCPKCKHYRENYDNWVYV